ILRHHGLALLVAASFAAATVWLYIVIPKGFLPTQDTGIVRATTIASPNISFAKMSELQRKAAAIIQADPAVADVASYVGDHVISVGTMLMNLKPPDVRKDTIDHVIGRLREKLAHVNGLRVVLSPVQDLTVGTGGASHRYQYVMRSLNQDELVHWARVMLGHIRSLPQAADLVWNYDARGLGATVNINRARAAEAGTTVAGVD